MESKDLALRVAQIALDKHALSTDIIHVAPKVDYASYVVICSGATDRQVDAIVSAVETELKKEQVYPLGIEGKQACQWVLIDYGDVICHVFEDQTRGFYDLDGLWIDADRVPVGEAGDS